MRTLKFNLKTVAIVIALFAVVSGAQAQRRSFGNILKELDTEIQKTAEEGKAEKAEAEKKAAAKAEEAEKKAAAAAIALEEGIAKAKEECIMINGVCWATRNVDDYGKFAANPEDAGKLFRWGDVSGENNTTKRVGSSMSLSKATVWESKNDPSPIGYRLPSMVEIDWLMDENAVTREWTSVNEKWGMKFTDKRNGNSIFLCAAGNRDNDGFIEYAGRRGAYWSNTAHLKSNTVAYAVIFGETGSQTAPTPRALLYSIRPVLYNTNYQSMNQEYAQMRASEEEHAAAKAAEIRAAQEAARKEKAAAEAQANDAAKARLIGAWAGSKIGVAIELTFKSNGSVTFTSGASAPIEYRFVVSEGGKKISIGNASNMSFSVSDGKLTLSGGGGAGVAYTGNYTKK